MWEMIERMATDRLWIYTAPAGSIFGAPSFIGLKIQKWLSGQLVSLTVFWST